MLSEGSQSQEATHWFHLGDILKKKNSDREQIGWLRELGFGRVWLQRVSMRGILGDDGTVLYFGFGAGYMY